MFTIFLIIFLSIFVLEDNFSSSLRVLIPLLRWSYMCIIAFMDIVQRYKNKHILCLGGMIISETQSLFQFLCLLLFKALMNNFASCATYSCISYLFDISQLWCPTLSRNLKLLATLFGTTDFHLPASTLLCILLYT